MPAKKTELFQAKYSKKVVEFIVDKIEDGLTLAEVCEKFGPPNSDMIPNEKTLYRWQKKYPEFKEAVRDAYKTLLVRLVDEKLRLAQRGLELSSIINETEDSLDVDGNSDQAVSNAIRKAKFELDAIKIKQRALEFTLTRIAPKFVPELQDTPKNVKEEAPQIIIKQYLIGNTDVDNQVDNKDGKTIQ